MSYLLPSKVEGQKWVFNKQEQTQSLSGTTNPVGNRLQQKLTPPLPVHTRQTPRDGLSPPSRTQDPKQQELIMEDRIKL